MTPRIAVVDDEARMAQVLAMMLRRDGHLVDVFTEPEVCLAALSRDPYDLLLTDLRMPAMDGVALLKAARAVIPGLPVILITAHATVQTAVEAMREGAFDYVKKPFENAECRALVKRALEMNRLARENRYLRAAPDPTRPACPG